MIAPDVAITRIEHDLLGDREVPADAYYGVHTLRAVENFPITGQTDLASTRTSIERARRDQAGGGARQPRARPARRRRAPTPSSRPARRSAAARCTTSSSST